MYVDVFTVNPSRRQTGIPGSTARLEIAEVGSSDGLLNRSDRKVSGSMPPVSATETG